MDERGNRCRAFHGIGQPDVEWQLCRLAAGANEKQQSRGSDNGIADGEPSAVRNVRDFREAERSEIPGDEEHSQQESGIADAIHDEGFVSGVRRRLAMEIKTDQQIGTQPHALPANKHQHIVIGKDQREHGEHEEVEVPEEAVIAAFMRHVSGGINMDEQPDAGDKQQPDAGERVEQETRVGLERSLRPVFGRIGHVAGAGAEPGVEDGLIRLVEMLRCG